MAEDGSVKIKIEAEDEGAKKALKDVSEEAENVGESSEDAAKGLKKAEKGLDGVGDSSKDTKKSIGVLDVALGSVVAGGISALISGAIDAAKSLVALAEETREYREDMSKLKAAFSDTGKSVDDAEKAYKDFYAILGESDRSVEAVNHLAELTNNTEELAEWSTIAAGVTAKFGDSLPIEGLTEAANETAKVGQVTGVLADALNWAGVSEDEFNKSLEACTTEQERASLITSTLNGLYSEAAAEYNELTASTQAANRATAELQAQQAAVGAVVEPLTTLWANFKANALEASVPALSWVSEGLQDLAQKAHEAKYGTDLLSATQRASLTAAEQAAQAFRTTGEAAAELVAVQMSNVDYVQNNLLPQLAGLVDANGKVQESDQARVDFILNQLNQALGTEYESIEQIIGANGRVKDSIYEVINAKKAQILLTAYEESYTKAIDGANQALERRGILEKEVELQEQKWIEAKEIVSKRWDELNDAWILGDTDAIASAERRYRKAQIAADNEERILDEKQTKYDESESDLKQYYNTIDSYETASVELQKGNTEKAIGYLNKLSEGFMTAEEARAEAKANGKKTLEEQNEETARLLGEQVEIYASNLKWLVDDYEANQEAMTEEQKAQAEARIKQAQIEAEDALKEFEKVGANITKGMGNGVENEESQFGTLANKVRGLVKGAIKAANEVLDSHSPSREFEKIAYTIPQGMAVGVEKKTPEAVEAVEDMTDRMAEVAESGTAAIVEKIEDKKPNFAEASKSLAEAMTEAIDAEGDKQKKSVESLMQEFVSLSESYEGKVSDIWAKLSEDIAAARNSYADQLDSKTQSIMGSMGLFDAPSSWVKADSEELSKNLLKQTNLLESYNSIVGLLKKRGLSNAFMSELTSLGVDATGELYALLQMTDEELNAYVAMWEHKSQLAREAATNELEGLKQETENEIKAMTDAANAEYEKVKAEYTQHSTELATSIKDTLVETGEAGHEALIAQLESYISAGESMLLSVGAGIDAQTPALLSKFANIAYNAENMLAEPLLKMQQAVAAEQSAAAVSPRTIYDGNLSLNSLLSPFVSSPAVVPTTTYTTATSTPVILEVDGRELGRAIVDLGGAERTRTDIHAIY